VAGNAVANGSYGCAIGSLANELADQDEDEDARSALGTVFATWEGRGTHPNLSDLPNRKPPPRFGIANLSDRLKTPNRRGELRFGIPNTSI
jgi:hypothetical protein